MLGKPRSLLDVDSISCALAWLKQNTVKPLWGIFTQSVFTHQWFIFSKSHKHQNFFFICLSYFINCSHARSSFSLLEKQQNKIWIIFLLIRSVEKTQDTTLQHIERRSWAWTYYFERVLHHYFKAGEFEYLKKTKKKHFLHFAGRRFCQHLVSLALAKRLKTGKHSCLKITKIYLSAPIKLGCQLFVY